MGHRRPRASGLDVSERGFIRVDGQLRSLSHPEVFAVGDCAEWAQPLPKAGVFAVRMGPVPSRNLHAALGVGRTTSTARSWRGFDPHRGHFGSARAALCATPQSPRLGAGQGGADQG